MVLWLVTLCMAVLGASALVCPDGSSCDDFATCCEVLKGEFGCCPVPNAVCCDDHEHCCPSGYTCTEGKCELLRTQPLKATGDAVCPGGEFTCPTNNTCCPIDQAYTCCPLPDATCCSDGRHCCPSGTTCDLAHETCNVPIMNMANATPRPPQETTVVCPGGEYQCPDGNTCCMMTTGEYGCCPLPNAVCCDDRVHCCPTGYTCESGRCSQLGSTSTTSDEIGPVLFVRVVEAEAVHNSVRGTKINCPDGHSHCPDNNTCCQLKSGDYGCCPMRNATCCSDHIHCCPSGTTCDQAHRRCSSGIEGAGVPNSVPWFEKTPAMRRDVDVDEDVNEV